MSTMFSRRNSVDGSSEGSSQLFSTNPVLDDAKYVLKNTTLVKLNHQGIQSAALYIHQRMVSQEYSPRTWRTHPLHLLPPDSIPSALHPSARPTLDWIFLVSSLNFSFWSEYEGSSDRYAVDWRGGWDANSPRQTWDGYWSLLAALNRAIDEGIPITDPYFYSSPERCPDSLIRHVFRQSEVSVEPMPLLNARIKIMREVGSILCSTFSGSFQGFIEEFSRRFDGKGTALDAVMMVTECFPQFRDEAVFKGRQVRFWKRAQILVAETWAAFYPENHSTPHVIFPRGVSQLTMFADYRVPQILHQLDIITYDRPLMQSLASQEYIEPGSEPEVSIRAASILAVEELRLEIIRIRFSEAGGQDLRTKPSDEINSVLIDFWLWDLAKRIEGGKEELLGLHVLSLPAHRTRSIWY